MGLISNCERVRSIGSWALVAVVAFGGLAAGGLGIICPGLLCLDWVLVFAGRGRGFNLEFGVVAGGNLCGAVVPVMDGCPLALALAAFGCVRSSRGYISRNPAIETQCLFGLFA